jgi:hypothetical protein
MSALISAPNFLQGRSMSRRAWHQPACRFENSVFARRGSIYLFLLPL